MAKARAAGGHENYGLGFIALVLFTLALYAFVQGFGLHLQAVQTGTQAYAMLLGWYFVSVLLMAVGKMVKMKAMGKK